LGVEIQRESFTEDELTRFRDRLRTGLVALEQVLARPGFGEGERTIGAELEMFVVDGAGRPLAAGDAVVERLADPRVTHEMGAFNVELNTDPVALAGTPFSRLLADMAGTLARIRAAAAAAGGRIVVISVLPTFRATDFRPSMITQRPRYRALAAGLRRLRQARPRIDIDGEEPLTIEAGDVAMEGANTSFQIHLRAAPREFAALYNAAMMATAPALAAAGNSPTFLGHRLWHETRTALFKQAGDDRPLEAAGERPPRVGFGTGWVRAGAHELFAENVALYEPLLPVLDEEDPLAVAQAGGLPKLSELVLHHGTVWDWNRAVYHGKDGGHLRIELRALAAGPTLDDMLANAAFLVGTVLGLAPSVPELLPSFPFPLAERNFYRAARSGLDAELVWPQQAGAAPEKLRAADLVKRLLPVATVGLQQAGVAPEEIDRYLGIIGARAASGITGAVWQRRTLAALERTGLARDAALTEMTARYLAAAEAGAPVHTWPVGGE
jgi:hypothetical protein